jgi:nitroimidazol reductase NimA-like FMN-containing flavoprotein (pyridoxamine 5'-phosphate oxidase superfamily)
MQKFDDEEIDRLLTEVNEGVLALASDDEAYGVPVAFGYDGERLIFQLGDTEGRKMAFIEESPAARFVVYTTNPNRSVESVVVEGDVERVSEDDRWSAFAALRENAEFPVDGTLWGKPPDETDAELYTLEPREMTGRAYGTGVI